jgi:hypothetical protein
MATNTIRQDALSRFGAFGAFVLKLAFRPTRVDEVNSCFGFLVAPTYRRVSTCLGQYSVCGQVDALWPIAKGAPEEAHWHNALGPKCSLTDALDKALEPEGLFALGDYLESANEVLALEQQCKVTYEVFGLCGSEAKFKKSRELRGFLATTRAEALLLRLFSPDALAHYDVHGRDERVRSIKALMSKHGRWVSVFKPVHKRATEAMALK